jgi:hypothetical protein
MPILLMALLALLVFGLIGILLSAAVLLEHSKRSRLSKVTPHTPRRRRCSLSSSQGLT